VQARRGTVVVKNTTNDTEASQVDTKKQKQQQQQAENNEGMTEESAEDKKARRRRMHKEADRVRRAKETKKIEIEVLQRRYCSLCQTRTRHSKRKMESLVQDANDVMATSSETLSSS
jgi:hypothetical protein